MQNIENLKKVDAENRETARKFTISVGWFASFVLIVLLVATVVVSHFA